MSMCVCCIRADVYEHKCVLLKPYYIIFYIHVYYIHFYLSQDYFHRSNLHLSKNSFHQSNFYLNLFTVNHLPWYRYNRRRLTLWLTSDLEYDLISDSINWMHNLSYGGASPKSGERRATLTIVMTRCLTASLTYDNIGTYHSHMPWRCTQERPVRVRHDA